MSRNHEQIKNDPRWKAARLEALERDDWRCVRCASDSELEVDHIIPLEQDITLAFEVENLQTLCRPCHQAKGKELAAITRNTWINPRYQYLEQIIEPNL